MDNKIILLVGITAATAAAVYLLYQELRKQRNQIRDQNQQIRALIEQAKRVEGLIYTYNINQIEGTHGGRNRMLSSHIFPVEDNYRDMIYAWDRDNNTYTISDEEDVEEPETTKNVNDPHFGNHGLISRDNGASEDDSGSDDETSNSHEDSSTDSGDDSHDSDSEADSEDETHTTKQVPFQKFLPARNNHPVMRIPRSAASVVNVDNITAMPNVHSMTGVTGSIPPNPFITRHAMSHQHPHHLHTLNTGSLRVPLPLQHHNIPHHPPHAQTRVIQTPNGQIRQQNFNQSFVSPDGRAFGGIAVRSEHRVQHSQHSQSTQHPQTTVITETSNTQRNDIPRIALTEPMQNSIKETNPIQEALNIETFDVDAQDDETSDSHEETSISFSDDENDKKDDSIIPPQQQTLHEALHEALGGAKQSHESMSQCNDMDESDDAKDEEQKVSNEELIELESMKEDEESSRRESEKKKTRYYKDTPTNRRLNRVGQAY